MSNVNGQACQCARQYKQEARFAFGKAEIRAFQHTIKL
jgi:hypothetical protein